MDLTAGAYSPSVYERWLMTIDRRLVEHLRGRTDVQNIDLMNLAGFCRNCLSNWYEEAAKAKGLAVSREDARERVYGMPYGEWKAKHQNEASPAQDAAFKSNHKH